MSTKIQLDRAYFMFSKYTPSFHYPIHTHIDTCPNHGPVFVHGDCLESRRKQKCTE